MTPAEILDFLTTRGVSIKASVWDEGLEISGPLSALTSTLIDRLRAREAELVAYLLKVESQSSRESRARIARLESIGAECVAQAMDLERRRQMLNEMRNGHPPIDGACVRVDRALTGNTAGLSP